MVELEHVPSASQLVDVLTKRIRKSLVAKFVESVHFTNDVSWAAG